VVGAINTSALFKIVGASIAGIAAMAPIAVKVDSLYERKADHAIFAADMGRALSDIHHGLQDLRLGQLQTRQALLRQELFGYQVRGGGGLSDLEKRRAQDIRDELRDLEHQIQTIEDVAKKNGGAQ
jgi:hypothetical protein